MLSTGENSNISFQILARGEYSNDVYSKDRNTNSIDIGMGRRVMLSTEDSNVYTFINTGVLIGPFQKLMTPLKENMRFSEKVGTFCLSSIWNMNFLKYNGQFLIYS